MTKTLIVPKPGEPCNLGEIKDSLLGLMRVAITVQLDDYSPATFEPPCSFAEALLEQLLRYHPGLGNPLTKDALNHLELRSYDAASNTIKVHYVSES